MEIAETHLRTDPVQVAIIEDDNLFANNLQIYLEKDKEFEVCINCISVTDSIDKLSKTSSPPDVILLDIHLPSTSGIKAIATYKALLPGVIIIMLTLEDSGVTIQEAFKNGADGYLLKTETLGIIYNQVLNMIRFRQPALSQSVFQSALSDKPTVASKLSQVLTRKEQEVAELILKGLMYKEIAYELNLSLNTVQFHMKNIYLKFDVKSRTELLKLFTKMI